MGILLSCCLNPSKSEETGQLIDERTRLFAKRDASYADLDNGSGVWYKNSKYSDESFESDYEIKTDEQNNRIGDNPNKCLDKLAEKMIDITTIDQPIDRMEWKRRQELYKNKMSRIRGPLVLRSSINPKPDIQAIIFDPISNEDIELINRLAELTSKAVDEGFRVHCEEPVVVPFEP